MREAFPKMTSVYKRNREAAKPVVLNVGGADSSKSYSIAQLLIEKFFGEKDKAFLVVRKTMPSNRLTAYRLIINLLKEYDRYRFVNHNKSFHTIEYGSNFMQFSGLDDPEKIKSAEFNYEWLEESNEFSWEDFIILKLRLRRKTTDGNPNRMYLSCNPTDEHGWINTKLKSTEYDYIHSTYKDNPFSQLADIEVLEGLKNQDESYYKIYALGEYAEIKGLIWGRPEIPQEFPEVKETVYGMDFGYNNPSTLIEIGIDIDAMALYFRELIYETHLTNDELIEKMKTAMPPEVRQREIYADASEPARIEEIYKAGFNIKPADKGKGSVKNGIDMVKRFRRYSLEENMNLNTEFSGYKWKVDKNGNVLDEPVEYNDHSCDGSRYAVYTHMKDRLKALGPGKVYYRGQEKRERTPIILDDIALVEKARQMIAKHGHAALGAFAYSLSVPEDDLRKRLTALGFNEHKRNRFIYGKDFKLPPEPEPKPEIEKLQEEKEGWVV